MSGTARACLLSACLAAAAPALAEDGAFAHGMAVLGTLKYPADFTHFEYTDPDAPKGGAITLWFEGTFDSLNPFILKGVPAAGSNMFLPGGSLITFQSLMTQAQDEPDSYYGLIAEGVRLPDDRAWVEFRLRDGARWHDGSRITPEDVAFSLETLREKAYPQFRVLYRDIEEARVTGPREVRFIFEQGANTRDLPSYAASMPIISRDWYAERAFEQTTLEPPMASGIYKVARVDPGRSISYERVRDHWAAELPVYRGRFNFDRITWDYYRDRDVALEAFFAGKIDFREEFTSRDWATKYDVPAVRDGRIVKAELPDESPSGTQGFFLNTRRAKFADPRVREALGYAFDFEWSNRNLFYSLYQRTTSVFENSDLAAKGPPSPSERRLLEPYRDVVPPKVFETAYAPPATDGSGRLRQELRTAQKLLAEAGWTVRNGELRNAAGERFTVEFLASLKGFERIIQPYIRNLERIGIAGEFRLVESSQYVERVQNFDYDIVTTRFSSPRTPGVELRARWGSESADLPGSQNLAGVRNPAVDALIETVIQATDRQELTAAARALDRVIMWGHYMVPQWYKGSHTIAYWDRFGRPGMKPRYELGFTDTWWIDPDKAAALKARR